LSGAEHINHLLLPGGADAMHVDRAFLHDVETFRQISFMKKVAVLLQGAHVREIRDCRQFVRRQSGKKLGGTQRRGDGSIAKRGYIGRHRSATMPRASRTSKPADVPSLESSACGTARVTITCARSGPSVLRTVDCRHDSASKSDPRLSLLRKRTRRRRVSPPTHVSPDRTA